MAANLNISETVQKLLLFSLHSISNVLSFQKYHWKWAIKAAKQRHLTDPMVILQLTNVPYINLHSQAQEHALILAMTL